MHPGFVWRDEAAALAFAAAQTFAHLFVTTPAGPRVAHVPVLIEDGHLRFHLANANALTPHLHGSVALASIAGPNAYVSPNWYAGADQVPTWNYLAVEIEGAVTRMDAAALVTLLDASAAEHEPRVGQNWTRAKMDPARFGAMCTAITGFDMTITAVRATAKLSQNKRGADFDGALAGIRAQGEGALAEAMAAERSAP